MNKIYNKLKNACLLVLFFSSAGCNAWLDIEPTGVQTSGTYWQTKEEVEQVLMSSYLQLRECMPYCLKWGEIRADALDFGSSHNMSSDPVTKAERSLRQMEILPSNVLCKWSDFYKAIGRANSVIAYSATALKNDITFTPELSNSFVAEAVFVRSLCYFYLVRTFRDVPLVLEPYADDSQDFFLEKTEGNVVINRLISDLELYKFKCKPGYEEPWQSKGRATSWAYYALLAEIYLWRGEPGDYDKVIDICENKFRDSGFKLILKEKWMSIYYPGNSDESIFELQYKGNIENQRSELYNWFWGGDGRYLISMNSRNVFEEGEEEADIRGKGNGYDETKTNFRLWKYAGTQNIGGAIDNKVRGDNNRSPNWLFYRYADILLMKAEAWVMKGDLTAGCKALDEIRFRAGITKPLSVPASEGVALELVMKERQKEFLGEGKRWFDILRMARRDNYKYKTYLTQVILNSVSAKDRPVWKIKLEDEYSHYLPIYTDEIKAGHGILVQNPFYKDVE